MQMPETMGNINVATSVTKLRLKGLTVSMSGILKKVLVFVTNFTLHYYSIKGDFSSYNLSMNISY